MLSLLYVIIFLNCYYLNLNAFAYFSRHANSRHTINDLLKESRRYGNYTTAVNEAKGMLQTIKTVSAVEITGIIQILGESGRLGDAISVLRQMEESGVKPNEYHLSALIQACRKANQWEMALSLYERQSSYNIKINSVTGNCIISTLADARQFELALDIFNQLKRLHLLTEFSYSAMIIACERQGMWQEAIDIYLSMKNEKCTPNTITFNNVLKACINNGQYHKACDIFYDSSNNVVGDTITYSLIIVAHGNLGQFDQAWRLFFSMDCGSDTVLPSLSNSLQNIAIDTSDDISDNIKNFMISNSNSKFSVKRDCGVYNAMISTCSKTKHWKEAIFLLDCMGVGKQKSLDKLRVYPDIKTFTSVINCLGESHQWQEAYQVFQRYNSSLDGVAKDSGVYYSIISVLQIAFVRLKLMESTKDIPNNTNINTNNIYPTNDQTIINLIENPSPDNNNINTTSSSFTITSIDIEKLLTEILQDAIDYNKLYRNNDKTQSSSSSSSSVVPLPLLSKIPYATEGIDPSERNEINVIDLHGLPNLVAQAQINRILRQIIIQYQLYQQHILVHENSDNDDDHNGIINMNEIEIRTNDIDPIKSLLIITGRGNHINDKGTRRILRQEIELFINQQFSGLLLTFPVNNDGCIFIKKLDLLNWLENQSDDK